MLYTPQESQMEIEDFSRLANSDQKRFDDLKKAILNPEVKAIWCMNGGYGTIRLISRLLKEDFKKVPPKLFIGFSDITLLLIYFQKYFDWNVIHGPIAWQIIEDRIDNTSVNLLNKIIFGKINEITVNLTPLNKAANNAGKNINGSIVGGNLTLTSRTVGTNIKIDIKNKFLFLEDISEPFRKVDGMLKQLELADYFSDQNLLPAAVIFGDFTYFSDDEFEVKVELDEINKSLKEFADKLDSKKISPCFLVLELVTVKSTIHYRLGRMLF